MHTSSCRRIPWEPLLTALIALLLGQLLLAVEGASAAPAPETTPTLAIANKLLPQFLSREMRGVESIVFAARALNPTDGHWYANFGYYSHDPDRKAYAEGAKLYRLNLHTRELTALLADKTGGVRDPQVSYDGKKILFSYRPGGTEQYHL